MTFRVLKELPSYFSSDIYIYIGVYILRIQKKVPKGSAAHVHSEQTRAKRSKLGVVPQ